MHSCFCKFLVIVFALFSVLSAFSSCAPAGDLVPSLDLSAPFSARVEGSIDGLSFSAVLDCSAEPADGGEREYTVTFAEPESLSGIVLRRAADGSLTARLGNVTLPQNDLLDGMIAPAELLLEKWETVSVHKTDTGYDIRGKCDEGEATFVFGGSSFPETASGEYKGRSFDLRILPLE